MNKAKRVLWRGMTADRDGKKLFKQEAVGARGGSVYVDKLMELKFSEHLSEC